MWTLPRAISQRPSRWRSAVVRWRHKRCGCRFTAAVESGSRRELRGGRGRGERGTRRGGVRARRARMDFPDDLKYTREHEWLLVEGSVATVGITSFAEEQLGDVVFIELPAVGDKVVKDEAMGVVESVKAVSDVYAPVSGTVLEVNDDLPDNTELVNEDPYGDG